MLVDCFGGLGKLKGVRALRSFLNSTCYVALVVILMVCANLFSIELAVYYTYMALGVLCLLLCDDMKGIIPLAACCYMTVSAVNNPAVYGCTDPSPSVFYDPQFKTQITTMLVLAGVLLIGRLLSVIILGKKKKVPALAIGFAALGCALVLGGLFTKYYDLRTAFFGFVTIAALGGLYFFFYYGVHWEKVAFDEWARLFTLIGCGVAVELVGMYVRSGILVDPSVNRGVLVTGWGMYNNVGCVLAMCTTAPLYLALKKKHGWAYAVLAIVLYVALLFTQSRSSMLFGSVILLAGAIVLFVKAERPLRKQLLLLVAVIAVLAVIFVVVVLCVPALRARAAHLFSGIIDQKLNDNGRFEIYQMAIGHFREAPFFGVGFYQCSGFRWGNLPPDAFLPPRYHSTYMQLLASGGIFALACYLMHRVETVALLFRRPTAEKTFIALSIGALILTAIVDCHFFNFGPGLLYGILLAYAEGSDLKRGA